MVYELSSLDCHYLPANLATGVVNVLDLPFYSDITVHALEMQLRFARADTIACAPNHGALPHWIECEIALVQRELERRRQHERRTAGFMFV
ncbi:hypothetical protein [Chitinimonas koreensis]|nr:hypothetical protein [Chitinimonas koreensis]QNM95504.1 hypothetical protein H9L41_16760 [Chitinimonas koreensis]